MSVVDMDRIFEISVNKIEHSKSRKVYGKSTMLHRTLLVNTVINRVRNSDRTFVHHNKNEVAKSSFTNYREPKSIYDMDEYEMEKPLTYTECQTRCKTKHNTAISQKQKTSSLVTLLNSRALSGKTNDFTRTFCSGSKVDDVEGKENMTKDYSIWKVDTTTTPQQNTRHEKRRCTFDASDETQQYCPKKKLRCIWPSNVTDVNNYSITGLASLFGDLVASSESSAEKSTMLNSNFATAMVAC